MEQILNGDCLELMPTLESNSIDMVLCDLPYGTQACKWDTIIPFEPMWAELKRIVKPDGAICLFSKQPFTSYLVTSNPKMYRYSWIWKKNRPTNFLHAKHMPLRDTEEICVFGRKSPRYYPQMLDGPPRRIHYNKNQSSLYDYTPKPDMVPVVRTQRYPREIIEVKKEDGSKHPTRKPVALCEYLIKTYSQEGETVLDFCMGSGSSGQAAKKLNRNFIGIELDADFFELAKQNIENTTIYN